MNDKTPYYPIATSLSINWSFTRGDRFQEAPNIVTWKRLVFWETGR